MRLLIMDGRPGMAKNREMNKKANEVIPLTEIPRELMNEAMPDGL